MKTLGLALSFLTTIPFPHLGQVSDEEMSRTTAFFPAIGLVIGLFNTVLYLLGRYFWGAGAAAWLWLAGNGLLTGGLHLDGWMDTFDALGSRKSREEMLAIMKDSRIGAMGGIAAIILLGLKWSLLTQADRPALLALAPLVGRSTVALATRLFAQAREKSLGRAFAGPLPPVLWAAAGLSALSPLLIVAGPAGLMAGAAAITLSLAWGKTLAGKFGGLTGDNYGALNEASEVIFLLALFPLLGVR